MPPATSVGLGCIATIAAVHAVSPLAFSRAERIHTTLGLASSSARTDIPHRTPVAVMLPLVCVPMRQWTLHFSLISQIDGLLFSLLGIRLNRDVLAPVPAEAQCAFYGRGESESCSAFLGLYVSDYRAVQVAVRHHACGVFVVPQCNLPSLQGPSYTIGKDGINWHTHLVWCQLLSFNLPLDARVDAQGNAITSSTALRAIFANFSACHRFKAKRRPETLFELRTIPLMVSVPCHIGTGCSWKGPPSEHTIAGR